MRLGLEAAYRADRSDGVAGACPERLRESIICRRGDGREQTLADLANAGTVRGGGRDRQCPPLEEAHGGRVRAVSAGTGRGTRIAFTLPADATVAGQRITQVRAITELSAPFDVRP